eukprot:286427_1
MAEIEDADAPEDDGAAFTIQQVKYVHDGMELRLSLEEDFTNLMADINDEENEMRMPVFVVNAPEEALDDVATERAFRKKKLFVMKTKDITMCFDSKSQNIAHFRK